MSDKWYSEMLGVMADINDEDLKEKIYQYACEQRKIQDARYEKILKGNFWKDEIDPFGTLKDDIDERKKESQKDE